MKKILILILFFMLWHMGASAQPAPKDSIAKASQTLPELNVIPEFPNGIDAFRKLMADHCNATANGKFKVQFVVEKDGSLSNIILLEGINEESNQRLIKALENSPKWTPGYQNGKPVRSMYTVPITIKVNKD